MDTVTDLYRIETNHVKPERGCLLISEPFLMDPNFSRSVVLLIEHTEVGSMGLVLNKPTNINLGDVFPQIPHSHNFPIYQGGPVGHDTLFFLHTFSNLPGAVQVSDGLWLNGDFELLKDIIAMDGTSEGQLRFFLGYAGWDSGQLRNEIDDNNWLVSLKPPLPDILMPSQAHGLWKLSLTQLGGKYALWARFPRNPILN